MDLTLESVAEALVLSVAWFSTVRPASGRRAAGTPPTQDASAADVAAVLDHAYREDLDAAQAFTGVRDRRSRTFGRISAAFAQNCMRNRLPSTV